MPVYTCKKKEKYDQLILEMYTRVELPFTVEHQRGGGLYAFTALVVARVILEGLLLEV